MFSRSKSVGHLVNQAARRFTKYADRRLKPLGLSAGQIPVLISLAEETVLSQKSLVQGGAIEQPTMAATLARMERDGLVRRNADPTDARTSLFRLTFEARAKLPQLFAVLNQGNAKALAGLSAREQSEFRRMLDHVNRNLSESESVPVLVSEEADAGIELQSSRQ